MTHTSTNSTTNNRPAVGEQLADMLLTNASANTSAQTHTTADPTTDN